MIEALYQLGMIPGILRRATVSGVTYEWVGMEPAGMGINPSEKECVGFICESQGVEKVAIGSCFLVVDYTRSGGSGMGYVVTAKHVVEPNLKSRQKLFIRLNSVSGGIIYQELRGKWYYHHDPSVDLAVIPFTPAPTSKASFVPVRQTGATAENFKKLREKSGERFFRWPPEEGDPVLYIAMTWQLAEYDRNLALVRHANIALVTDEQLEGVYGPSEYYLIESQIYQSNSGAPVYKVERDPQDVEKHLMFPFGVLVAAYPALQEVREKGSGRKKKSKEYYNLGIAFVVPIIKVIELLDESELQDMRKKNEPKPPKPVAVRDTGRDQKGG